MASTLNGDIVSPGDLGDPAELTALLGQAKSTFLAAERTQQDTGRREQLARQDGDLAAALGYAVQRDVMDQQLDVMVQWIREAEARLAAIAAAETEAAEPETLTVDAALMILEHFDASDAAMAAYKADPERVAARLTRIITSQLSFDEKLHLIREPGEDAGRLRGRDEPHEPP